VQTSRDGARELGEVDSGGTNIRKEILCVLVHSTVCTTVVKRLPKKPAPKEKNLFPDKEDKKEKHTDHWRLNTRGSTVHQCLLTREITQYIICRSDIAGVRNHINKKPKPPTLK
jgi:hypothetical protein